MSDYTPTTEEVRMAYEIDPENPFFSSAAEWTGDEFDRWLAEVKAQAHQAERENIIGYLQSEIKVANEWCEEYKEHCTPDDEIRNSTVVATYKNLVETLIANPYRQGEN